MKKKCTIIFEAGTIILENPPQHIVSELKGFKWDKRTSQWRAEARNYRPLVELLTLKEIDFEDHARAYKQLSLSLSQQITPRDHQSSALKEWCEASYEGTVCIPTGGGKTILAVLALNVLQRSCLVVVPTLDLMHQWYEVLTKFFGVSIGLLGGGYKNIFDITVATYDSAFLNIDHIGNKFAFLVFDECHHLPGEQYQKIAICSIAPFRLGLSATVERQDGKQTVVFDLIGPMVYEGKIKAMIGHGLSPYDTKTIEVTMTSDEKDEYDEARKTYTSFLFANKIRLSKDRGWMDFISIASRSRAGKRAMQAYRKQKVLAQASSNKILEIWKIIMEHPGQRIIIFTNENDMAYKIGHHFVLPVLTHKTKVKERKMMLDLFRKGEIKILVTSKVLNEGVDVPEASVAIIVSGSGAVREHVQRLGRILRDQKGKRAVLYELISKGTSEKYVNQRRREHDAYQGSSSV